MKVEDVLWDFRNIEHIAKHKVTPGEVLAKLRRCYLKINRIFGVMAKFITPLDALKVGATCS